MGKKIAFVLSGGGAKGALQVGMLNYLINTKFIAPNSVYGISTGSLQGLAIAQNDIIKLNQVWNNIRSYKDIFSKSILNYLSVIFGYKGGLYKFDGLKKLLNNIFSREKLLSSGIMYNCGYVDLNDGILYYKNSTNVTIDDILASCTIPIAFPPVNNVNVDGGVRDICPLKQAIKDGADEIYILTCSPVEVKQTNKKYNNILDIVMRTLDIMTNEILINDIKYTNKVNNLIGKCSGYENKRFVKTILIAPKESIIDTLEFIPEKIKKAIEYGYNLAKNVINSTL